jgi:hypothetical protein
MNFTKALKTIYAIIIIGIVFYIFYIINIGNNSGINFDLLKNNFIQSKANLVGGKKSNEKSSYLTKFEDLCLLNKSCELDLNNEEISELLKNYFTIKKINYFEDITCNSTTERLLCVGRLTSFATCNIEFVNETGSLILKSITLNDLGLSGLNDKLQNLEKAIELSGNNLGQNIIDAVMVNDSSSKYKLMAIILESGSIKLILVKEN